MLRAIRALPDRCFKVPVPPAQDYNWLCLFSATLSTSSLPTGARLVRLTSGASEKAAAKRRSSIQSNLYMFRYAKSSRISGRSLCALDRIAECNRPLITPANEHLSASKKTNIMLQHHAERKTSHFGTLKYSATQSLDTRKKF
jgi:hypothetical protein